MLADAVGISAYCLAVGIACWIAKVVAFGSPRGKLTRLERRSIDAAYSALVERLREDNLDIAPDERGERVIDAICKAVLESREE